MTLQPHNPRSRSTGNLVITLGIVLALLMVLWKVLFPQDTETLARNAPPPLVTARGDLADDEKNTIEVFEKARVSVVYISTIAMMQDLWSRNIFAMPKGTGSGFIWDDAGHIVTNFHVIEGATEALVKLADGREFKAALVGASAMHDIAVLKIDMGANRLRSIPIGTSHDLKVGQKVFAIGNPFGLDWTLTNGIVSALDRSLGNPQGPSVEHLIQTDAAINPGNSGGPLLDSAGRLIGINTAIYSPSGASAGIGFAVPVDTVMRIVPELVRKGRYIRPALGIEINQEMNDRLTAMAGVKGVAVLQVQPGSAADKAGLRGVADTPQGWRPGDFIVELNGKAVKSISNLLNQLDDHQIGDAVKLKVVNDGKEREVAVTLQAGS